MIYYIYCYVWVIDNIISINSLYQKVNVVVKRAKKIMGNTLYDDCQYGIKEIANC
ncbi:MAG: hypothetical protein RR847_00820 [Bacilli bacterium]